MYLLYIISFDVGLRRVEGSDAICIRERDTPLVLLLLYFFVYVCKPSNFLQHRNGLNTHGYTYIVNVTSAAFKNTHTRRRHTRVCHQSYIHNRYIYYILLCLYIIYKKNKYIVIIVIM